MVCPECGNDKTLVLRTDTSLAVERYRKCAVCGYSFLTVEKVKADSSLEEYSKIQDESLSIRKNLKAK